MVTGNASCQGGWVEDPSGHRGHYHKRGVYKINGRTFMMAYLFFSTKDLDYVKSLLPKDTQYTIGIEHPEGTDISKLENITFADFLGISKESEARFVIPQAENPWILYRKYYKDEQIVFHE